MTDSPSKLMDKAEIEKVKVSNAPNFRIENSWKDMKKRVFFLAVRYQNSKDKAVNINHVWYFIQGMVSKNFN